MDKDELNEFKRLSFEQQEFYLMLKKSGSKTTIYGSLALFREHKCNAEYGRRKVALSDRSFILVTNNERVKEAYRKLIAHKPNTDFNG